MKRLLKVQQEIGTLSKNAKNPFFKSQYLDLTTIIQHVTPLLNAEGLLLLQPLSGDMVTSAIVDAESGDTVASSSLNLPNITDPQKLGSAITYFRRYTLKSLLAIAEEDDDGNKASKINAEDKINACKTLKELQTVYTSLSKQDQLKHVALKDELKTKLK